MANQGASQKPRGGGLARSKQVRHSSRLPARRTEYPAACLGPFLEIRAQNIRRSDLIGGNFGKLKWGTSRDTLPLVFVWKLNFASESSKHWEMSLITLKSTVSPTLISTVFLFLNSLSCHSVMTGTFNLQWEERNISIFYHKSDQTRSQAPPPCLLLLHGAK